MIAFQQKCLDRMRHVIQSGTTLLLVSHDLATVGATASRGIWLADGTVQADGPIDQTLAGYRRAIEARAEANADVKGLVRVRDVSAEGTDGRLVTVAEDCTIRLSVESDEDRSTMLYLGVSEGAATPIFVVRHAATLTDGRTDLQIDIDHLPLPPRQYFLWFGAYEKDTKDELTAWQPVGPFIVSGRLRLNPVPRAIVRLSPVRGRPLVQSRVSGVTGPPLVLLVGAPRSGTTWLQSLLGAHPSIATPQETDLFSRYIGPLAEAWSWQLRGGPDAWRQRRYKGLPAVLTTVEFTELVRGVVETALDGIARLEPEASVLLEKSPSHSMCADVVAAYAPEARVIHLIRDGRDVASSLVGAADGWGRGWAPRTLKDAARAWVENVRGAQRYRKLGFVYHEVRYEALAGADPHVLRGVYAFCGFDVDVEECARLYKQYGIDAMRGGAEDPIVLGGEFAPFSAERTEPEGFFGPGSIGGWRDSWSTDELLLFRAIAGPLLEQLGYEQNGKWAASRPRLTYAAARGPALRERPGGSGRRVDRVETAIVLPGTSSVLEGPQDRDVRRLYLSAGRRRRS